MLKRMLVLAGLMIVLTQADGMAWVTRKNFEKLLSTWEGDTGDSLVASWGAPNQTYNRQDGGKILTYMINTSSGTSVVPVGETYMAFNKSWYCKVTFTLDSSDRIVNWSYQGNNCRSKAPKY